MIDALTCYAAGFFDGEGSIDIKYAVIAAKNGKRYERFYLRVQIVQLDASPLLALQKRWGGSICNRSKSNCKSLVWTTESAGRFLRDVLPYLIVKAREAALAIEFQETMRAKLVNTAGSKGVDPLPDEVRQRRYDLMHAIRKLREEKGLFARPRMNVPAMRAN